MSEFTEPDRRRRKRRGQKLQDPASLTSEEQLIRLQRTLEARRTQWYEESATKKEWLEQLQCAKTTMHGAVKQIKGIRLFSGSRADKDEAIQAGCNSDDTSKGCRIQPPSVHVVCLGLGKINESRESQYQLLQLSELADFFETTDVWIYDPLLEPVDISLIEAMGYRVLTKNYLGRYRLPHDRPAFAYLPHCPRGLYEAFIKENWAENALGWQASSEEDISVKASGRHVIVANDFRDYALSLPSSRFRAESPFLAQAVDILSVTPLPKLPRNHPANPAFSSLAWMHLPRSQAELPTELEGFLQRKGSEDFHLPLGEMIISDIGQSIRLQSDPPDFGTQAC